MKKYNWLQKSLQAAAWLFGLVLLLMFAAGDAGIYDLFNIGGTGLGLATLMGAIGNIDDVENSKRVGKQVKAHIWILSEDQWDQTAAFPTRTGITRGNIPLKNGEYWHYIDAVLDSPEVKSSAEEGEIASEITNELTFILGGLEEKIHELLEKGIGQGFFIVWELCATGEKFLGGNGCKPLKLTNFEGGSTKDSTSWTVTFKNMCGEIWSKYSGNLPTQAATVVNADATTITLTSNSQYQLTDGSAAVVSITDFTSVTDADIGRKVTILGSGGTYPSKIVAGGNFILKGGVQWDALTGKQITVEIWKDDVGSYVFIEQSRS